MKNERFFSEALTCLLIGAILLLLLLLGRDNTGLIDIEDVYSDDFVMGVVPFSAAQSVVEASNTHIEYFDDFFSACNALAAGKIDGFVDDCILLDRYASANDECTLMHESYGKTDICAVMRRNDDSLYLRANTFIRNEAETLNDMYKRWTAAEPVMPVVRKPESPVGTLRIITSGTSEPYSYIGENGKLTGYEIELGMRFAAYLNMDWEFVIVDSYSLISSLVSGRGDIVLSGFNASDEAKGTMLFTYPYLTIKSGVLVQSSRYGGELQYGGESFFERTKRNFESTFITESRWKSILSGLGVTLYISSVSFIFANVVGYILCKGKSSESIVRRKTASVLIKVINGLPILIMIMLMYYVIFRGIKISGAAVAIVGFSISYGGELALVFETGISSVGKGQLEAAESIGFTKSQTFRYVILPQAANTMFSLYKWQFVSLIKSTSIVGYIAVLDLTKVNDLIRSRTYAPFFPLICSSLIYFLITQILAFALTRVEYRFDPRRKPRVLKGVKTE